MNLYDEYKKTDRKYFKEISDFENDFKKTKNRIKGYFKSGNKENVVNDFDNLD